jgi:glycosyltransferase involved in cell wall biosynthesis
MRFLVWQWGRFGAGPRVAADFAAAFNTVPGTDAVLSLSAKAEILQGRDRPRCELPVRTYGSMTGYVARVLNTPRFVPWLQRQVTALHPAAALCAMPGPLDLAMHAALSRAEIPYAVVVHDADLHPGDGHPFQMTLQRALVRRAGAIVVLSEHVRLRLEDQGLTQGRPVLKAMLPPYALPQPALPPRVHGGKLRLLFFGRLLPYKGLDLLADSLRLLLPREDLEVRVVGQGPEGPGLAALRRLPGVSVENRWVPEDEVASLLAWSDALVLTHREASQSGVAAAAAAAGRWVIATKVGGLEEQLRGEPMALLCAVDAQAVADALRYLLKSPKLPEAASRPGWQEAAGELAEALGETLVRTRRRKPMQARQPQ